MKEFNFKNLSKISDIQGAKEGSKEIFTSAEKLIFTDTRISGNVTKAQDLAELIFKVQQAEKTFQEDHTLHD
jgi:hypothetical protein